MEASEARRIFGIAGDGGGVVETGHGRPPPASSKTKARCAEKPAITPAAEARVALCIAVAASPAANTPGTLVCCVGSTAIWAPIIPAGHTISEDTAELFRQWTGHARPGRSEDDLSGRAAAIRQPQSLDAGALAKQLHDRGAFDLDPAHGEQGRLFLCRLEDPLVMFERTRLLVRQP